MLFKSTRNPTVTKTLSAAILNGLADDGGLYVPTEIPMVDLVDFSAEWPFPYFAEQVLKPFFYGDPLLSSLGELCEKAFNFPIPVEQLNDNTWLLELYHGPTLSFKDVGARFLAECFDVILPKETITILVATSGDTGSAVASAFFQKPGRQVIIFYPKGKVSDRQEQQLTCWGENVLTLAVNGTFDDCQRLVKEAMQTTWWQQSMHVSSANSINIGRLLPQICYYAYTSMRHVQRYGIVPGYIVPTGNVGNACAAYWAKAMGFPIREIQLAINANKVLVDYVRTGIFEPRASIQTLANAMDVGNPSNFERLVYLYSDFEAFKKNVAVMSVTDDQIKSSIKSCYDNYQHMICPHTATAYYVRDHSSALPWYIVATADACKFNTIVEPIVQKPVIISSALNDLLQKPRHVIEVEADLLRVQEVAEDYFHLKGALHAS